MHAGAIERGSACYCTVLYWGQPGRRGETERERASVRPCHGRSISPCLYCAQRPIPSGRGVVVVASCSRPRSVHVLRLRHTGAARVLLLLTTAGLRAIVASNAGCEAPGVIAMNEPGGFIYRAAA
jgi:hypothetical protein